MSDPECVRFLQDVAPRLRLRWAGFRRVRRQVCRRITRRIRDLGLSDLAAYRSHLDESPDEWRRLDALCRVTISRFHRDRRAFAFLTGRALPSLAAAARNRGEQELRVWSVGCASGEEPYTVAIAWQLEVASDHPGLALRILATDADASMLARAREGIYPASSLRDLPDAWRRESFVVKNNEFALRARFRAPVELRRADVRDDPGDERFHLVLCRNLVFTYYDEALQREILSGLVDRLEEGGALVIGARETLPPGGPILLPWDDGPGLYRKSKSCAVARPGGSGSI